MSSNDDKTLYVLEIYIHAWELAALIRTRTYSMYVVPRRVRVISDLAVVREGNEFPAGVNFRVAMKRRKLYRSFTLRYNQFCNATKV